MSLIDLRKTAETLFHAAIEAADPAAAQKRHLMAETMQTSGCIYLIAIGKASVPMMRTALEILPPGADVKALAVTNYENAAEIDRAEVMPAGHPVPDENGATAAARVIEMLRDTTADDRVIALISGGGSALLPSPVEGVSLEDKAKVNALLLGAGLDIHQMNEVRQQLSRLKGGGLLHHAAPAPVSAFILSDVVGDDLRVIASGPTVAPIGTHASAAAILREAGLWDKLPASVVHHLDTPDAVREAPVAQNTLICSNRLSLDAMQRAATGYSAEIVDDLLEGNVVDVAPRLVEIARRSGTGPKALIFGGETTVTLTGSGRGGRNQDLALRFAQLAQDMPGDWVFLSGGTDGRDGPTDAAGGLVDRGTIGRITEAGEDADALLGNNDSYRALAASGDLLMTGGTGTNVADVMLFLKS